MTGKRIFGGVWPNSAAVVWWLTASSILLFWEWIWVSWALVGAMALEAASIALRWRAWARTAHRPHVDPDWHARVPDYQGYDSDRCQDVRGLKYPFTWLEEVLWAIAAWAPFGGKMIWRGARPYMARIYLTPWWSPRQVFLHRILLSDDGIHNHPYGWSCSFLLTGSYMERRTKAVDSRGRLWARAFFRRRWLNWIPASAFHAIDLDQGPVWTLFVCGPRDRPWGFLDDRTGEFHPVGAEQRPDIVTGYGLPGENLKLPPTLPPELASQQAFRRRATLEIPPPPADPGSIAWLLKDQGAPCPEAEYEVDLDDTQPMAEIPRCDACQKAPCEGNWGCP